MRNLLKFMDDRLSEPSTWAAIAAALATLGVHLDSGALQAVTLWGTGIAVILGVVLSEAAAGKSPSQIANDIFAILVAKTNGKMPPSADTPPSPPTA